MKSYVLVAFLLIFASLLTSINTGDWTFFELGFGLATLIYIGTKIIAEKFGGDTEKGLSSVFGTLIFLVVLVSIFSIFATLIYNQASSTTNVLYSMDKMKQTVMFQESYEENVTYLMVSEPITITYIIYPNGTVQSTNIAVHSQIPVSKILGKQQWVIIVSNTGYWYNVTNITVPTIR